MTDPDTKELLNQFKDLLQNFEVELSVDDLRTKVQALVPVHELLSTIGKSLIPKNIASGARDRLLHYFLMYPRTVLPREELVIVAGIDEWARRIRELRVEMGWAILSGIAAKQMAEQEEFPVEDIDVNQMGSDDYILIRPEQDRDAAHRWNYARQIRNSDKGVREKILEYLRQNVGREISGDELRYVAKDKTEWARRVRELRTEQGWPVVTRNSGRPDLAVGIYMLEMDRQSPVHDRKIPDPVRRRVLTRDKHTCQKCSWNHDVWNRSDPRHLELHHIHPHVQGGENTEENLISLCIVCHDEWHSMDGSFGSDEFYGWIQRDS